MTRPKQWGKLNSVERGELVRAQWERMPAARKDLFIERVREAALKRYANMSVEERRRLTEKARTKRWKFVYY